MLPNRVLGLPQSIEIDYRPDKKFREGFIVAPDASRGCKNRQQVPLFDHLPKRGKVVPYRGEDRNVSVGRSKGVA